MGDYRDNDDDQRDCGPFDNDHGDLCDHITCDIIEVMKPYLLFSQSHHMKIMIIILKKVKVKFISNDE